MYIHKCIYDLSLRGLKALWSKPVKTEEVSTHYNYMALEPSIAFRPMLCTCRAHSLDRHNMLCIRYICGVFIDTMIPVMLHA